MPAFGCALLGVLVVAGVALANPYPDPDKVPKDPVGPPPPPPKVILDVKQLREEAFDVLRVDVAWDEQSERWTMAGTTREVSGTPALMRRASFADPFGSYRGELIARDGRALFRATVGTGAEFRRLTRAASFRFPLPFMPVDFRLLAENPETGVLEEVLRQPVQGLDVQVENDSDLEVRLLQQAATPDSLQVNVYAEGYTADRKERFFEDAARLAEALHSSDFPSVETFEMRAVWSPSKTRLGSASNLGLPIPERDSFLGLYFPYWRNFGRWYNVVYPTREKRFRDAIAKVPYDYPIALIDDGAYWGIGNFMELTAIPARNGSFTYLLLHEFGHFFGLNEEYEGGGATELAFAPGVDEPWSQNITFLREPGALKWSSSVPEGTAVPTPSSAWHGNGPFGAYRGGYADTAPLHTSHKPGFRCTMEAGRKFCPICREALEERVRFDVGKTGPLRARNR